MQDGRVVPLLLDLDFKEISGPLAQFQAKKVDSEGIKELIFGLNKATDSPVPQVIVVERSPSCLWKKLESDHDKLCRIGRVAARRTADVPTTLATPEGASPSLFGTIVEERLDIAMAFQDVDDLEAIFDIAKKDHIALVRGAADIRTQLGSGAAKSPRQRSQVITAAAQLRHEPLRDGQAAA